MIRTLPLPYYLKKTTTVKGHISSNDKKGYNTMIEKLTKAQNGMEFFYSLTLGNFKAYKGLFQPMRNVLCLRLSPSTEEGVYEHSLAWILKQNVPDLPLDFDFLGLQEAGYSNYWILRDFLDFCTYKPKVVLISFDFSMIYTFSATHVYTCAYMCTHVYTYIYMCI